MRDPLHKMVELYMLISFIEIQYIRDCERKGNSGGDGGGRSGNDLSAR